jgi:hypothetical protein
MGGAQNMHKQKQLFKQLRRKGATIKQTRKGHYMIKHKIFTYTLSGGFAHSKQHHEWRVKEIYKKLKLKY